MNIKINEEARTALLKEVQEVSDHYLNLQPADGGWSIKQILEHLYLMEHSVVDIIKKELTSGEDKEAKQRKIELTVDRTVKVDAPDYLVPSDDVAALKEMTEKLEQSHFALQQLAEAYDEEVFAKKALDHPAFGKMNLAQWILFVGYHEMRHTKQIQEVKASLHL